MEDSRMTRGHYTLCLYSRQFLPLETNNNQSINPIEIHNLLQNSCVMRRTSGRIGPSGSALTSPLTKYLVYFLREYYDLLLLKFDKRGLF